MGKCVCQQAKSVAQTGVRGENMRLFETMMEECAMMDKVTAPDGMGGTSRVWQEGAHFQAAIVKNTTLQAILAEKQGVTELYQVTFPKGIQIDYHDVIKRVSDGAIFRVTSNVKGSETPGVATFQFGQVTAERWELQ